MVVVAAAAQSPVSSGNIQHSKSGCRKPLEPKNNNNHQSATKINTSSTPKPKQPPSINDDDINNNKENILPPPFSSLSTTPPVKKKIKKKNDEACLSFPIESLDASLAEELSAIREKLDRLRIDRENTEKLLVERALMLDLRFKDLIHRGDTQKQLEIELDRLYRLNQIKLASCLRRSPVRTLREKEQEKKMKQEQQLKANFTTEEEIKDEKEDERTYYSSREEERRNQSNNQSQGQILNLETPPASNIH